MPDARAPFTAADGRRFAFPVGGVFLTLAMVALWRERETLGFALGVVGAGLVIAGLLVPSALGPTFRAWMRLAAAINRVTSPVVLGVLWFVVITPFALLSRALGRRSLARPVAGTSRWTARLAGKRRSDMQRQF